MEDSYRTDGEAPPPDRLAYYATASAWASETTGSQTREAKTAWRLAGLGLLIAALNGVALAELQPLRKLVSYVIRVDDQRGSVLALASLQPGRLQTDPAMIQSMVARYVIAREGFGATRLSDTFRLVELMSDPAMRADYAASLKPTSGHSPLSIYPPQAIVDVSVISVSLVDAQNALVRYATVRSDLPGAQPQQALANVGFRFSRGLMRQIDRFDNPLGFQVTSYSTSPG